MCLFFNACYFPFWLVVDVVVAADKYEHLNYLYKVPCQANKQCPYCSIDTMFTWLLFA